MNRPHSPQGAAKDRVASASPIRIEIICKLQAQVGFAVHARRWVVERFFAWIGRNRRLALYFQATIDRAACIVDGVWSTGTRPRNLLLVVGLITDESVGIMASAKSGP